MAYFLLIYINVQICTNIQITENNTSLKYTSDFGSNRQENRTWYKQDQLMKE